jgi:hypothetical protein
MSETVINRPAKIKAHNTLKGKGLTIERIYTNEGVHPYDEVKWERRDVVQQNWRTGETVFEQRGVEYPDTWSVNASTCMSIHVQRFRHLYLLQSSRALFQPLCKSIQRDRLPASKTTRGFQHQVRHGSTLL